MQLLASLFQGFDRRSFCCAQAFLSMFPVTRHWPVPFCPGPESGASFAGIRKMWQQDDNRSSYRPRLMEVRGPGAQGPRGPVPSRFRSRAATPWHISVAHITRSYHVCIRTHTHTCTHTHIHTHTHIYICYSYMCMYMNSKYILK